MPRPAEVQLRKRTGRPPDVSTRSQEVAMLTILLATCKTSLQTFKAADNAIDAELVADLERMVARTGRELDVLMRTEPSDADV
jgi:hypothetical protein